jgi:predicted transcriptional regulator
VSFSLEQSAASLSPPPTTTTIRRRTTIATTTNLRTMTRRILQATIESSDVDHFGGTTQSRIITYARIDHKSLKPYLDVLVELGLLTKQIITHDNAHHARCTWEKTYSKRARYKMIYKVSDKGYSYLQQQQLLPQEQDQQKKTSNPNQSSTF